MSASYSIITSSITETSVKIQITPDPNYRYYRVFVRLYSDSSDSTYDKMFAIASTTGKTITGLTPGTRYVINVGYTNDNSTDRVVGWIGSKSFYTLDEDTNYYVKIRYNANGGSGAPSTHTETGTSSSVSVTLSSIEPTREGYTFLGWSRSSSATSPSYYPGRTYKFSSVTMGSTTSYTLYAVWEQETVDATYIITNTSHNSVTIRITPDSKYQYYRVLIRLFGDASNTTYNGLFSISSTTSKTITGLTPDTQYVINVGYTNDNSTDRVVGWIGSNSFWTNSDSGVVYIGDNAYAPYIYVNGSWTKLVPYVYSNSWKKTKKDG